MQGSRVKFLETLFVITCAQMSHIEAVPFPRVSDAEHDVQLPSLTAHDRETLRAAV
jgi:hypothetical protein